MSREEAGRKGGLALFAKIGREGMRERGREGGKRGIRSLANRYFDGSIGQAMEYLRSKATEFAIARGLAKKHEKQIAEGATIICEEIPVVTSPDNDPFFHEPWVDRVKRKPVEIDLPF